MITIEDIQPHVNDLHGVITFKDVSLSFYEIKFPDHNYRQDFIAACCDKGIHAEWVFDTGGMRVNVVYLYPRNRL
jgi:hypothetical protein